MNPQYPNHPLLGIDVSKLTFDACLLLEDGGKASIELPNDPDGFARLDTWLTQHGAARTLAGLEATGPYGVPLLWHLHSRGHLTAQLNPRRVKDYARSQGRRVKTDRTDAHIIAQFLRHTEHLVLWQPPHEALIHLQALVRRRQDLMDALQAERNRLAGCTNQAVQASLDRHIQHIKAEARQIDKDIDAHVMDQSEIQKSVRLLRSIDGVGRMVAVTILAEVPQISAFTRARDLAAFAGLTPSLTESGTSVRKRGRMTKEGSALLRKMLYMGALQAVKRTENAFHETYKALTNRGKAKKVAIGAIMHKIIRVAFGVLKHQMPFVKNLAKI